MIRRRHDRLDARAGDDLKDSLVVSGDDDATDRSRLFGALDDAQNHRPSCDLDQWFAWQSGRGVAGGNDCDDVVSHKPVAGRGLILRDEASICLRRNVSRRAAFFFFVESLISVADSQQVTPILCLWDLQQRRYTRDKSRTPQPARS